MRIIGLGIHRVFAEAAWEDGRLRRLGRVDMRRDLLAAFAAKLSPNDVVVILNHAYISPDLVRSLYGLTTCFRCCRRGRT
ncbi:hypothetical protein AJ88_07775 [Mesorhizobium amorphae CCBAU 01583]|nr:hypothetical protein AJ88_37905 [Mesorhizobium amorphae CCBAU 01583]OWK21361.1 hypothetical protein AJ88_07775 [Mesorhizobium amorphae CCBAU 01583]